MPFDHLLLIGFGGPEKAEDIRPFIREVTQGANIPEERLREVEDHYAKIGGRSPYNEYTARLADKIKGELERRKISLPVFTGMRCWHPFLAETLSFIQAKGLKKGIGIVLAPHRSEASYGKYLKSLEEAKHKSGVAISYEFLPPWHEHPGFIDAQADRVRQILDGLSSMELDGMHLLFTAHSIPVEVARQSQYEEEIRISAALVAKELNCREWSVAYQSRSGSPRQPWLEPDVCSVIRELAGKGVSHTVLVPIGFLCDNAEVLYDLDIEARAAAEKAGIVYLRASTVMDHPQFAGMLADRVAGCVLSPPSLTPQKF